MNVNVIDVRRKVDALLEEESDMEQEVLTDKKRKRVTRMRSAAAVPETDDVDIVDDANPSDILPPVGPAKMKMPVAALDESDDPEANNQTQADSSDEEGDDSNSTATTRVRRTNGLIQVKDEPNDDTMDCQRRKRVNKGDIKPPTTLASLKKDGYVQGSFTWDCIKEAAKDPGSPLKPMLDMVGRDDVLKSRAIAYVWSGASQLRGELARKARDIVIFQLQQICPKEIGDIANKKDPLFCGELDLKARNQFFQGAGSEGLAYMEHFQKLPNNLIALLATAGECAYKGMLTGSPVVVEFKEPIFQPRHQYYMLKLNAYHEHSPMYMEKLCKDLWTELEESCRYLTRQLDGDSDSELDFDAIEEFARPYATGSATTINATATATATSTSVM
ncbi:hypothetical protein EV702DRAFT_1195666 [Suillus placidus]|uniref:DUF6532 domain-containing protein n=1 Tax=Suillus placidus TaxID=48579 RepID=A0A9P6ZZU1_9AGAM|nr:hypothetical protein EV702DRAFT_1195666 [Suillus placidus]